MQEEAASVKIQETVGLDGTGNEMMTKLSPVNVEAPPRRRRGASTDTFGEVALAPKGADRPCLHGEIKGAQRRNPNCKSTDIRSFLVLWLGNGAIII